MTQDARLSPFPASVPAAGPDAPASVVRRGLARLRDSARHGFGLIAPPDAREIAEEQARNLRTSAFVLSFFGTVGIVLLASDFAEQSGTPGRMIAVSIVAVYAAWCALALAWGRRKWFLHVSLALLVVQGALWGSMVHRIAETATARQSNFVVAIAMALVSTPMLGAPFTVAIAFWLPVAIGAAAAIGWALRHADSYLGISFVCYELFTLAGIVFINRTLLDNAKARLALKSRNATVSLLLRDYEENAADWLWGTDAAGALRGVSARFAEVLRRPAAEVEGRSVFEVLGLAHAGDPPPGSLPALMADRRAFRDVPVQVSVGGEVRWWSLSGRAIEDASGRFLGYRGVGSDVTDAKRADEAKLYLATHDALTGVGNRRMFHDRMAEACQLPCAGQPSPPPLALVMLDLDRFKQVNDDYGHEAGDEVLRVVTARLKRDLRPGDTFARLGGDEFAVLLPRASQSEAAARAARFIALASEPVRIGDVSVSVGASAGTAMYPTHAIGAVELARKADLALYRSKEAGRGVHRMFDPSFNTMFHDRLALLAGLRAMVESAHGVGLQFQPIVDVATGETVCMEALCRWHHPGRGEVPPSVFIPLAEECGLIGKLGQQVLWRSCMAAAAWDPAVSVSVNLSSLQLRDPGFPATVAEILHQTGLKPHRLELEITESTRLASDAQTHDALRDLEALGIAVVLDDFGTGQSSLSTLHNFRFHGLKIDAQFTRDASDNRTAAAIVRLVARLASELGVILTAEGVETEEQLRVAKSLNVTRVQGFLLGRPADLGPPRPALTGEALGLQQTF